MTFPTGDQSNIGDNFQPWTQPTPVPTPQVSNISALGYETTANGGSSQMGSLLGGDVKGLDTTNNNTIPNTDVGPGQDTGPSEMDLFKQQHPGTDINDFNYDNSEQFMGEINSQYDARNEYLTKAEAAIREGQPDILEGIAADLRAGQSLAGASKQAELGTVAQSEQQGYNRKENALDASRRLYNELRMGVNQRFGRASNVGEAAGVLLGREQQVNMNQTRQGFGELMGKLGQAKTNIETTFNAKLEELKASATNFINQANQEFRSRLDEVNQNRLLASDAKSQARLGVLTDLRDKMFSIKQANAADQRQLEMMKQAQLLDLDTYRQKLGIDSGAARTASDTFNTNTSTDPSSQYTPTGQQFQKSSGITSAVGQIGNRDDDSILGQFGLGRNYYGA